MTTTTTSARKGKRALLSLTAIALFIGVSSGLVYSQGLGFESAQASAAHSEASDRMTASRKVWCIMPEAQRRHCEL